MKKREEEPLELLEFMNETRNNVLPRIEVTELAYIGDKILTWQELFAGFESIRAITYSSGISFVADLLDMYKDAEVIFGCEDVMSFGLKEVMAFQETLIEKIRENRSGAKEKIMARIANGSAHFYVAEKKMSHEKIYLLSNSDGRKRVILGSANMSLNAFSGRQRENISFIDGEAAYDKYSDIFETLKTESADEISRKAIEIADLDENIDALPISEKTRISKVVTIENSVDENVQFIMNVDKKVKKLAQYMPKEEKKSKKTLLGPNSIVEIRRHILEDKKKEQDLRSEYPHLVIDIEDRSVMLNGIQLDLRPNEEEIKNDVALFLKYMEGYKRFHGDVEGIQRRYYEFANWFFCSPFMAVMRENAARFDRNKLPYPVFGLLYGQSKAGKTSFLETLLKMMIGQKPKMSAPDFTRSSIETMKNMVKGAPIIVDDLTNTRFNQHAIETIKNDDFGLSNHMIHYPAVVISANEDVKAVASEIVRRTVICRVEAGLTNTEVMKDNIVRMVQQKIGTAFYREYLRRMILVAEKLIDEMQDENVDCAPDILRHSSETFIEILNEYATEVPEYFTGLSLENYYSEQVTGKYAIKTIQNAWKTNRKSFRVERKNDELIYNAGATYEADRIIKELPENLVARKVRECIIMKLSEAEVFFDVPFGNRWFWKKK